jgi:glycosyltransferase involved in cell wall biosynthesis
MLGTFGMRPKGTMSARAAGIASALRNRGIDTRIATVPWDNPSDAGRSENYLGVPVTNTRTVSPYLWPLAVRELIQVARDFRPDLIHVFKPKGFGDLAARALQRAGYPAIVDMDDWEGDGGWNDALSYSRAERALFNWQERTWPRHADGITAASRTLHHYALSLGAAPERTLYLPNQLHSERFRLLSSDSENHDKSPRMPIDEGIQRVLLYTRFVEFDPAFVIDVLKVLNDPGGNAELVVAGRSSDGVAERLLRERAEATGLSQSVRALGWIHPEQLGAITRQCQAALVPFDDSRINRAKCSVKLLEVLATGLPVVASSVGENREYIVRHGGGLLARPGDTRDHAERLLEILRKPERIPAARFHQMGCWSDVVDQVLDTYHGAISHSTNAR